MGREARSKLWGVNKTQTHFYELKKTCGKNRLWYSLAFTYVLTFQRQDVECTVLNMIDTWIFPDVLNSCDDKNLRLRSFICFV